MKENPGIPYTMQLFVVKDAGRETYTVLKMIMFQPKRLAVPMVLRLVRGQGMRIEYGSNTRTGTAAFQLMLERLGGFQVRYYSLDSKGAPRMNPTARRGRRGTPSSGTRAPKLTTRTNSPNGPMRKSTPPQARSTGGARGR